jgi:hypothetical protein
MRTVRDWARSLRSAYDGERQKVGGPVLATVGHTARRTTRGINRLKGSVADLLQPCDTPTPDFLALSL